MTLIVEINDLYDIVLLGWFLSQCVLMSWCHAHAWIELLCSILKPSKLAQLVIQVQYHMNVIYSLSGGHKHIATT